MVLKSLSDHYSCIVYLAAKGQGRDQTAASNIDEPPGNGTSCNVTPAANSTVCGEVMDSATAEDSNYTAAPAENILDGANKMANVQVIQVSTPDALYQELNFTVSFQIDEQQDAEFDIGKLNIKEL